MSYSLLSTEVSLFDNYKTSKPSGIITLLDWLTTDKYQEDIEKIRASKSDEEIKRLKSNLPAITPSGIFHNSRSAENLFQHSGFVCIDIDGKDNPTISNWQRQKEKFAGISEIAYCGLSASGKGVFILVAIESLNHHSDYIKALSYYFLLKHHIVIDKSCKDVSRLRGASYDLDPYFNHLPKLMESRLQETNYQTAGFSHQGRGMKDASEIMRILQQIKQSNLDVTARYADWFKVGAVIANSMGENGRAVFREFSQFYAEYDAKKCDKQFDACLKRNYGYGVGTLKYLLKNIC